jgi:protein SCO1/2
MKLKHTIGLTLGALLFLPPLGHSAISQETLSKVRLEQNIGAQLPLQLSFRDETGRAVTLQKFFGQLPVILVPVYYKCPTICPQTLGTLANTLRKLSSQQGGKAHVVVMSIDPRDTSRQAAAQKKAYLKKYGSDEAASNVTFLTGGPKAIRKVAETVGFHYAFDPEFGQYAHAVGLIVLTPDGKVARYIYGFDYTPRDLRLAVADSAVGTLRSTVDRLLLFCYHYDPAVGRYGFVFQKLLQTGATASTLLLGFWIVLMMRREKRPARRVVPPMWRVRMGGSLKG